MAEQQTSSEKEIPILSRLRAPVGAVQKKKRKGRGVGSGLGKTAGKGSKGQKARHPGGFSKPAFEGGQVPTQRRLPKFGFVNIFSKTIATVNLKDLGRFAKGAVIDEAALRGAGLLKGNRHDSIKLLGNGEVDKAFTVRLHAVSASAKEKIEKAGGKVDLVPTAAPKAAQEA